MPNVFTKKSAKEVYVQLSNGRIMSLPDIIEDYERLLQEEASGKTVKQELRVGEWFLIDRDVIAKNREKIHRECNELGNVGKEYWERFEESNKIADENPDQYSRIIKTYIFKHNWKFKVEEEMRYMCDEIGNGQCDEVICDLELQMRICNGESAHALFNEPDSLPRVRVIQLRNGGTGYFGGSTELGYTEPPATLCRSGFNPINMDFENTPYAFLRVVSQQ